jgi:chaperone modulatory protein CbpM
MQAEDLIPADVFCVYHQIELSFIHSLKEFGLIEVTVVEEKLFLSLDQLSRLEMLIRFYYELNINLEGIETITHLLDRTQAMQEQIIQLSNRLKRYEAE